jgi:hypothetical protein
MIRIWMEDRFMIISTRLVFVDTISSLHLSTNADFPNTRDQLTLPD